MRKLVIALGLTVALSHNVFANTALQNYRQGNYDEAKKGLQKLVAAKNKDALYYYGLMTLHGYAVKKDIPAAIALIKQSAERGYLDAQLFLATYSLDVAKNSKRAFYWFQKAANKGDLAAQLFVASAYHQGFGIKKNSMKESKYIIRSAKNGSMIAQYYLAKQFIKKRSYRSKKLGFAWFKKSAKQNYLPAYYELALAYQNSYDKRQYWLDKLKQTKSPEANYYVGKYYLSFNSRDVKFSAIKWLTMASQQGHTAATYELGILHQSSDLNALNDKKAFNEISSAAQKGYVPAQVQLSHMFQKGIGTSINNQLANEWLSKSKANTYANKKSQLINWISNTKQDKPTSKAYSHNSALTRWQDKTKIQSGVMNQSPKMIALTKDQLFKAELTFLNPKKIDAHLLADTIKLGQNTSFNKLPIYQLKNTTPSASEVKDTYSRALLGNREAQFHLGQYHEFGVGVDKNLNAAAQWYFSSAKQNYLPAEYNLGLAFLKGQGIKQNLPKASYWLNRTAFKGNVNAQYALGILYQHGFQSDNNEQFINKDNKQSNLMYHLASGAGSAKAKFQLAEQEAKQPLSQYSSNFHKNEQHKKITQLYEQAYQGGIKQAQLPLAFYYIKEGIASEKQTWAFNVLSNEANRGNTKVALLLALMNERGMGTSINYNDAIKWYKVAAKNNSSAAQFSLGSYYYLGEFVNKNPLKAERLLTQAANNNLAFANYNLGVIAKNQNKDPNVHIVKAANAGLLKAKLFLADKQLGQDGLIENAAKIYQELANKGNEQAELKLAFMHQHGLYFKKNTDKATKYYLRAASKNNAMAQYQLGFINQLGLLGSAKPNTALHWYKKSAENNFTPAMIGLGFVYEDTKNNYTKAKFWYAKASNKQNKIANYNLALMLDYGKGINVDNEKAERLYISAANSGLLAAKLNLAHYYFENKGSNNSLKQSMHWFNEAANDNYPQAHFQLARLNEVGLGTAINPEKAKEHYQKALALGYIDAAKSLARLHQNEVIASAKPTAAYKLYLKSASKHDKFSKFQLANILYFGLGTDKSEKKAMKLFNNLAKNNFEPAKIILSNIQSINKTKSAHRKEVAKLKKKAKKEGTEIAELPKLNIKINQSIDERSSKIKSIGKYHSAEEMYLAAINELEKGKLYKSHAILKEAVNTYPNYKPAKKALEHMNKQEKALLLSLL